METFSNYIKTNFVCPITDENIILNFSGSKKTYQIKLAQFSKFENGKTFLVVELADETLTSVETKTFVNKQFAYCTQQYDAWECDEFILVMISPGLIPSQYVKDKHVKLLYIDPTVKMQTYLRKYGLVHVLEFKNIEEVEMITTRGKQSKCLLLTYFNDVKQVFQEQWFIYEENYMVKSKEGLDIRALTIIGGEFGVFTCENNRYKKLAK